jgi:hypothetical protein
MATHPHLHVFSAVIAEGRKTFNSDDHLDRPFLFMGVKANHQTKEEIT